MGRRNDAERMRRSRYNQSRARQVDVRTSPTPKRQVQQPRTSALSRFALRLMTLMGIFLIVIAIRQWFLPSTRLPQFSDFRLTSLTVDTSTLEPGDRILNLAVTQGWNSNHMGVDLALPSGQDSTGIPLYAIGYTDAEVEVVCWTDPIAGLNISTYADGMEFAFDYSHLNACATEPGERIRVKAGQKIAEIGNSGSATTGPHLHFQQRQNGTANPITGTHIPGWRGFVELSLSGKTVSVTGDIEDPGPPAPIPLVTPLPRSPRPPLRTPNSPQNPDNGPMPSYPRTPPPPDTDLKRTPAFNPPASGVLRSPNAI